MPVGELLARTSSMELTEWMAYFELDPFGGERDDLRAGIVASAVANLGLAFARKRHRPFMPKDFMPRFDRPRQTMEQQIAIVEMLNKAFKGKDLRQR